MNGKLKFFSQEWCDAAIDAINANSELCTGFKDSATFTNKMEFSTRDRVDVITQLEWEKGRLLSWTSSRRFDKRELWVVLSADLATWKQAAAGDVAGSKLLMQGRIVFLQGPLAAAIENSPALDNFLLTWGAIPTDWDV